MGCEKKMRLEQLRYFVEVGVQASVTKAAESMFTTPQNISKSIKQLENELGVSLFYRFKNGMFLTEDGLSAFESAQKIVGEVNGLKNKFADRETRPVKAERYTLNMIMVPAIREIMVPVLNRMIHNGFQFERMNISQLDIAEMNELLLDTPQETLREYDAIAAMVAVEDLSLLREKLEQNYVAYRLWRENLCLEVPASDPLANQKVVTLEQLRKRRFLLYASDAFHKTFVEQLLENRGVKLNVVYRCPGTIGRQFSQMHNLSLLIGDTISEVYPHPGSVLVPLEGPVQTDHCLVIPRNKLHEKVVQDIVANLDDLFSIVKMF